MADLQASGPTGRAEKAHRLAPLTGRCAAVAPCITEPLFPRHLENDFQLDRGAERKACDAIHQAARALVFSKDVLQELRSGVRDFWLTAHLSRSASRHAEPDDPRHFVERS